MIIDTDYMKIGMLLQSAYNFKADDLPRMEPCPFLGNTEAHWPVPIPQHVPVTGGLDPSPIAEFEDCPVQHLFVRLDGASYVKMWVAYSTKANILFYRIEERVIPEFAYG